MKLKAFNEYQEKIVWRNEGRSTVTFFVGSSEISIEHVLPVWGLRPLAAGVSASAEGIPHCRCSGSWSMASGGRSEAFAEAETTDGR